MKRITGLALMVVSGLATLAWVVIALIRGSMWSDHSYLLVLVPFLFFVGLSLVAPASPPDKSIIRKTRKNMILVYLMFSVGMASFFLALHIFLGGVPPPPGKAYATFIGFTSLAAYAYCYWNYVRKGAYSDKSPLLIPFFFIMGLLLSPLMAIDAYNLVTEKPEVLGSANEVIDAKSNILQIRNLQFDSSRWLGWWHYWNDKDRHHADAWGLMPVVTVPGDTAYKVWIDLRYTDSYSRKISDDSLKLLREQFYSRCWERIKIFQADSVVFFDRSNADAKKVFETNNYPVQAGTIFLRPYYESALSLRKGDLYGSLGIYVFITLCVWALTSGKLDRYPVGQS